MAILNKLIKNNDGLQDEIDTVVDKAVGKAVKETQKVAKTAVTDAIVEAKALGLDRPSTKAIVELLTGLKSTVVAA